jgi:hypothetical protein
VRGQLSSLGNLQVLELLVERLAAVEYLHCFDVEFLLGQQQHLQDLSILADNLTVGPALRLASMEYIMRCVAAAAAC